MKNKIQKGLIALLVTAALGCVSACGMFEWINSPSSGTGPSEVSESVASDKNADGEGGNSDKTENEQPTPDGDKPSEDNTQGGGENSDGGADEEQQYSDGKIELPEDNFN